jgi:threonylcarbamoyladenosine tRNA methylthiotransferase MtaB
VREVGAFGMRTVAFITVGCKLNQFETEQMREAAGRSDCSTRDGLGRADVCVVNTCTVTSKSDYRSRQAVRRAVKANPGALIIVTGCYAQRCPEEVACIEGVDVVLGNVEKDAVEAYLGLPKQQHPVVRTTSPREMRRLESRTHLRGFGSYTRAFVKIQDGCDNRCTYCAVPLARGSSRSKRPDEVIGEIETLAAGGYREVVLTGVHLGSYGRDLEPRTSLATLLKRIATVKALARSRLSSVEPTDLTAELVEVLADRESRICPHVHVPLQSGDDGILKAMGRPYGQARYREVIEAVAAAVPDCGIGADVMVGFPGETDEAFLNTCRLVRDLPITYLHVFAFSRRAGTPAAGMAAQVGPEIKKQRSQALRQIGAEKSRAFRAGLVGRTVEALVLGARGRASATGLAGNYLRVGLEDYAAPNTLVRARVTAVTHDGVRAAAVAGGESR